MVRLERVRDDDVDIAAQRLGGREPEQTLGALGPVSDEASVVALDKRVGGGQQGLLAGFGLVTGGKVFGDDPDRREREVASAGSRARGSVSKTPTAPIASPFTTIGAPA